MKVPEKNSPDYSPSPFACLTVPAEAVGRRLDQVLATLQPEYSRNRLQGLIRDGQVQVDGKVVIEPKMKLLGGEVLTVAAIAASPLVPDAPEDIPLDVVFEDDALLVINKPAGLVVHPGNGNAGGTLMNALLHRLPALASVPRAGIVHRLDKETSGLMVVAKTLTAQTDLVRQLQARSVRRQYLALVKGLIDKPGTVDGAIGRHPVQRTRMALVAEARGGKPAVTHYRILRRYAHCTLTECSLETGRTHQIRVHMASIGHPLVGDPVYGRRDPKLPGFSRQALHAFRLGLRHPETGEAMAWEIGLPADFQALLAQLDAA